jgi:hypothetical protein
MIHNLFKTRAFGSGSPLALAVLRREWQTSTEPTEKENGDEKDDDNGSGDGSSGDHGGPQGRGRLLRLRLRVQRLGVLLHPLDVLVAADTALHAQQTKSLSNSQGERS